MGVEEAAIPAVAEAGAKGAETAGAADLLAPVTAGVGGAGSELAAGEALGLTGAGGVAGATAEGLPFLTATGAEAAGSAIPGIVVTPGAAAATAGPGVLAGLGTGIGAGLGAIGDAIFPSAAAAEAPLTPTGALPGLAAPSTEGEIPATFAERFGAATPTGQGASAFAPSPGVQVQAPPDLTAAAPPDVGGAAPGTAPNATGASSISADGTTGTAGGAPQAGGSAGSAGTPTTTAQKGFLESLGIKNPLGAGIAAGGLAYSVANGQQQSAYAKKMAEQAASLNDSGKQLLSYLQSGTLPDGLKASLDQATKAAKAKIISNYASQGMPTDPTKNTALAQQLAQVDQQALISTAQMGQQLLQSGISETGLSSDLYKTLAGIDATQTANIGKAIASFASAISGTGGGIKINLPGASS